MNSHISGQNDAGAARAVVLWGMFAVALLLAFAQSAARAEDLPERLPPTEPDPPAAVDSTTEAVDGVTITDNPDGSKVITVEGDADVIILKGAKAKIDLDEYVRVRPSGAIWPQQWFGYSFVPRTGDSGFGMQDIEFPTSHTVSRKEPKKRGVIDGSLGFGIHLFDGPGDFPAPAHTFDLYWELACIQQLNDCWSVDLAVAPGLYSDFANGDDDRFRLPGRALVAYESSPGVRWVAGLLYLDWGSLKVLPAGGLIFQPHDNLRYELVAPRPRVVWRHSHESNNWWHAGAEYYGNSWGVERTESFNDQLTYSDFRTTFGWQISDEDGSYSDLEIGYVFSRELEYKSDRAAFYPNDAILLRWTIGY